MFNKIKNNQEKLNKKQEEKDAARAAECRKAVEAVLESYNVELQPYLIYHPTGVYPDVQFYPRPDKPNEPGQPASTPSGTASPEGAEGPASEATGQANKTEAVA